MIDYVLRPLKANTQELWPGAGCAIPVPFVGVLHPSARTAGIMVCSAQSR